MSELGQQLREARLEKGMSLDDVQEMTKIRKRYLEAIEAGDYKVLPGNFYVRAFIKTYAETVGIHPDELLEGNKELSPPPMEGSMEPIIQKRSTNRAPKERNVKWLSTALMWTFLILILAVMYIYLSSRESKPKNNVVDSDQKITGTINDPANENDNAATPPANEESPTPDNSIEEVPGANEEPPTEEVPPVEPQEITVAEDGKKGKNTIIKVTGPEAVKVPVEIKASGKSWVEVYRGKDSTGEKLYFGNTEAGDILTFELDSSNMLIKSGYSPATVITVAGQPITDGKTTSRFLIQLESANTEATTGE
ncbi:helix-turn-helix domain-containing protein [Paenibacillus sp. CMAA1364]